MKQWLRTVRTTIAPIAAGILLTVAGGAGALAARTPVPCAVTAANGSTPPGEQPAPDHHGNGAIWTVLWPAGLVEIGLDDVRPDGTLAMKWPWWRGVPGALSVSGVRLDGPAAALWAEAPGGRRLDSPTPLASGIPVGASPPGFQATALIFPTAGCWEVTARAGNASLTFVTHVDRLDNTAQATPAAAP